MSDLLDAFNDRLAEVEAYLDFLRTFESCARSGPPKLEGAEQAISVPQQRILYSSVYLQLYNLVESSMTRCIEGISRAACSVNGGCLPGNLSESLRKEWVRHVARTHVELSPDNRLQSALKMCGLLLDSLPIDDFEIAKGGGGNWDDNEIEAISERLGFSLNISRPVYSAVKRQVKNDLGPLALVKSFRNRLAHGSISFVECAEDVTVSELVDLKDKTASYMREVVTRFDVFLTQFEFLLPDRRPA